MKTNTLKLKNLFSITFLIALASLQPLRAGNELSDEEITRAVGN